MVKVELKGIEGPLFCPLCGLELIGKRGFQPPCVHVIYMGIDAGGTEFVSPEIDEEKLEESIHAKGMDQTTDKLKIPGCLKFALYEGAPSNMAAFVVIKLPGF